jgi:hypothetical protein
MIVIFGVLGYLFEKFKFPISPTVLGAIVSPVSETAFMPIDGRFAAGAGVSAAARDFRYAPAGCDRRHSG